MTDKAFNALLLKTAKAGNKFQILKELAEAGKAAWA